MHIINRLPTPKLNNKVPWDLLFMSKPDISHLRTFGCICFPLLWPYNTHKPQPHTTSCIFLGYPTYTKGYICLDPITSRIYISDMFCSMRLSFLHLPLYPLVQALPLLCLHHQIVVLCLMLAHLLLYPLNPLPHLHLI